MMSQDEAEFPPTKGAPTLGAAATAATAAAAAAAAWLGPSGAMLPLFLHNIFTTFSYLILATQNTLT